MPGHIKRIVQIWRPHRAVAIGLVGAMLLRAVFTVIVALALKEIIDAVVGERRVSAAPIVVLLGVGFVVSATAAVAVGYLSARAQATILTDLRATMFDHLQRLSIGFHATADIGDVMARFSTDLAEIVGGVVHKPLAGLNSLVSLAFFFPVMLALEWRLTLAAAIGMPLVIYLSNRFTLDADSALDEAKVRAAATLDEVSENLVAQPTIRAFGLRSRSERRFATSLARLRAALVQAEFRVQLMAIVADFGVQFVQLVLIGIGAILALDGSLPPGSLAGFIALLTEFTWESTVIGREVLPEVRKASSGIRRVDSLLAAGPTVVSPVGNGAVPALERGVTFDGVGFSYDGSPLRQLDAVDLEIPAARYTAIVGPSGSGKSTILSLLLRFYDPDAGAVMMDDVDIRNLGLDELRSVMGVVFQDTHLFNDTLRENLMVGNLGATDPDLAEAIAGAELEQFVAELPEGLDTRVGRGGRRLSGGQRQRVGLARALLRRPRLLLLDEATSALDPTTEAAVVATVQRLARHHTIVNVSHRLQTIADADQIVVVSGGRVESAGTFDALVASEGLFAEMWSKQQGFRVSGDGRRSEITDPRRLRQIPLFADLSDGFLERLAADFDDEWFPAGTDVVVAGTPGDRFYVIARGVVEVVVADADDGERVIAHLEDGDFFGEIALLESVPRTATVRAVVPTSALTLDREQFEALLAGAPDAARTVRETAARRRDEQRLMG